MDELVNKKPRMIMFRNFLIQITIIVYFTGTLLLFLFVKFNIGHFIWMFISIIISAIIILRSKTIPEQKIPKIFSQKFVNILKTMTDIVVTDVVGNEHPQVKDIKDVMQKVVIWNLRDGKNTIEFNQEAIGEGEKYCLDKLFPKKEIEQEQN